MELKHLLFDGGMAGTLSGLAVWQLPLIALLHTENDAGSRTGVHTPISDLVGGFPAPAHTQIHLLQLP